MGSHSGNVAMGDSLRSLREDALEAFVAELGKAHNQNNKTNLAV